MSEIVVFNFKHPFISQHHFEDQVAEIFFASSTKKVFETQKEKDDFFWKYVGFYLAYYPEYAWLAVKEGRVLGYVFGMPFTQDPSLYLIQPHLKAFEEYFKTYPAHLHINCHESSRGQGVGKLLVEKLWQQLVSEGSIGLHIMTGPESENRKFYQKLGFGFELVNKGILFMGKGLSL